MKQHGGTKQWMPRKNLNSGQVKLQIHNCKFTAVCDSHEKPDAKGL